MLNSFTPELQIEDTKSAITIKADIIIDSIKKF